MFRFFLLFAVLILGCHKDVKDVYYLPNNYEGPVVIYFDQADGQEEKYDTEGRRIFDFGSSGLLKSKFKYVGGTTNIKLCYRVDTGLFEIFPNPPLQPSYDNETYYRLRGRQDVYVEHRSTGLQGDLYSYRIFVAKSKVRYDSLRNDFYNIPVINGIDQPTKFSLLYDSVFNKK